MGQYARGNQIATKYTKEQYLDILDDCLNYITKKDKSVVLQKEIALYVYEKYKIPVRYFIKLKLERFRHDDDVQGLWDAIEGVLEARVVKSRTLSTQAQVLLMKNKHDYKDKKELDSNLNFKGSRIVLEFPTDKPKKKK